MTEIISQCPLCHNDKFSLFHQSEFYNYHIEYRLCQKCGLVFQSPRMTKDESDIFYSGEYYLFQENNVNTNSRMIEIQKTRAKALYDFVRPNVQFVFHHLDIGCSSGILLRYFRSGYPCSSVGIEPDIRYRSQSKGNNLTVYSSIDKLKNKDKFDLISMSHVLEHIRDPIDYLANLRKNVLTKDGHLLLEVPNLYAHDSFEIGHLFAFSPRTLKEALYKSGFFIIKFEKHGRPHSNILPVYLTVLCCPTTRHTISCIRTEKMVKLRRRFGLLWLHFLVALFAKNKWFTKG